MLACQKEIGLWPQIVAGSFFSTSVQHKLLCGGRSSLLKANNLNFISSHSKASKDKCHSLQKQQQNFSRIQKAVCIATCQGSFQGRKAGGLPEKDIPLSHSEPGLAAARNRDAMQNLWRQSWSLRKNNPPKGHVRLPATNNLFQTAAAQEHHNDHLIWPPPWHKHHSTDLLPFSWWTDPIKCLSTLRLPGWQSR